MCIISIQDVILWDWISSSNILDNATEVILGMEVRESVITTMDRLYNNVITDCDEDVSDLTECLNSIPDDILSVDSISLTDISRVADVVLLYQYLSVLCKSLIVIDELCEDRLELVYDTLKRIDILQDYL